MAKRRNKKDKINAKRRIADAKTQVLETKKEDQKFENETQGLVSKKSYLEEIFAYDPKLIVKDLKKTFLVVSFILLILLTIALIYT
jgi:hypothetical protein